MVLYHVKMPLSWKGPSRVTLALTVGDTRAHLSFDLNQEDEKAPNYRAKKLWLTYEAATELSSKGFSVIRAKQPEVKVAQVKPTRHETPLIIESDDEKRPRKSRVKKSTKRQPTKEDAIERKQE